MGFADRYIASLNASNLMDDDHHHSTEALAAAALADVTGAGLGALLSRVKYADGWRKLFESGSSNLAQLLRIWTVTVTEKGRSRGWVEIRAEWDISAAHSLYRRVAEASLAHFLDGNCEACSGTGLNIDHRECRVCGGTGKMEINGRTFEAEKIGDMASELQGLADAHNARAAVRMRRAA